MARQKSKVNPALLAWARESARLDLDAAATRAGIKRDTLEGWESGKDAPSIPQLRKLGEIYRRPIVVFFLPRPPKDFDALKDYRRLPEGAVDESPEFASEIRWAHEMREVALEALRSTGDEPPDFELHANSDEAPEVVAQRLLAGLTITPADRALWRDRYSAYRGWRNAIENLGVLCLQITGVDVREARGFAIGAAPLPTIAVNAADAVSGRIFTLLHELTHLALGATGLCDLHEARGSHDRDRIEVFCNAVAGEALVPEGMLRSESKVKAVRGPTEWSDVDVQSLATTYRVSREVILRRLLHLGLATNSLYQRKRDEFSKQEHDADKPGGGDYYNNLRSKLGLPLIQAVLRAYEAQRLTANEAAAYLRVKVDALGRLLA
jgi:Zn-dependent peptidase ImmA (M78 family)/transcriptional regulator with XRE-family HTH domain